MTGYKQVRWSNYIRVYGIHVLEWLIVTNLLRMHVYTYTRLYKESFLILVADVIKMQANEDMPKHMHTYTLPGYCGEEFPGSARQGKSKMKKERKICGYLLRQHADQIRKEYRAEARQANPREIVNSILHESLYLPEGEIKRYICIRDYNVQVHVNGEGKQEHVSCICIYKAGDIMFVYILCKVCLHRTLAD